MAGRAKRPKLADHARLEATRQLLHCGAVSVAGLSGILKTLKRGCSAEPFLRPGTIRAVNFERLLVIYVYSAVCT